MKKLLVFLFLMVIGTSVYAQKRFVTVTGTFYAPNDVGDIHLSGSVPAGISSSHSNSFIGDIVDRLASKGYVVEQMTSYNYKYGNSNVDYAKVIIIMSLSTTPNSDSIQHIYADDDSEAIEVARYNLQGFPVNKDEKGVQIVVYSNYTTKTVIVQ